MSFRSGCAHPMGSQWGCDHTSPRLFAQFNYLFALVLKGKGSGSQLSYLGNFTSMNKERTWHSQGKIPITHQNEKDLVPVSAQLPKERSCSSRSLILHEIQLRMQPWLHGIWCLLQREHPGLPLPLDSPSQVLLRVPPRADFKLWDLNKKEGARKGKAGLVCLSGITSLQLTLSQF